MAEENINPSAGDDEYLGMEVKQLEDEEGNDFYPKTHYKAVEGIERYDDGIIGLTNDLIHLADTMIYDTGWVDYRSSIHVDVKPNLLYSSDGFHCGLRQVTHYYGAEEVKIVTRKMIRVNIRNFANGQQIAQLPSGFVKEAQRFQMSGNGNRLPYTLEMLPNGKVTVYVHTSEQSNSASSNWIYGQFEWTE